MLLRDSLPAAAALLLWFPVAWLLFLWLKPHRAAALTLFLGMLYLPAGQAFILPLVPDLTRDLVPFLAILIANAATRRRFLKHVPIDRVTIVLMCVLLAWNVPRALANMDVLHFGPKVVPRIDPRTAVTFILKDLLGPCAALLVGASIGRHPAWLRDTLKTWTAVLIPYSLLILLELRLSPRIHSMVYGYFQHSWRQMLRDGGYRPLVFTNHALELALILAGAVIAALILRRYKVRILGVSAGLVGVALLFLLVLCKSFAAILYGVGGLLLLTFGTPRLRCYIGWIVGGTIILMPLLRLAELIPIEYIFDQISVYEPERARSFAFRFFQEEALLDKVRERPFAGWGGFARLRVFDPVTGDDLTVVDGSWIIQLMSGGLVRYWAFFGLMAWPLFRARRILAVPDARTRDFLTGLALLLAFLIVDAIPNAGGANLQMFVAGLLGGALTSLGSKQPGPWSVEGQGLNDARGARGPSGVRYA